MADSSEPFLLFQNGGLDINENMSQNCSFSKESLVENASSVNCTKNDSDFTETSNYSEISDSCFKSPETCSELSSVDYKVTKTSNYSELSDSCFKSIKTCSELPSVDYKVALVDLEECMPIQKADTEIHDSENNNVHSVKLKLDSSEQNLSEICDVAISDFVHEEKKTAFKVDSGIQDSESDAIGSSMLKFHLGEQDFTENCAVTISDSENNPALKADSQTQDSENPKLDILELKYVVDEQNFSENCGVMISDFTHEGNNSEFKEEEFHDAVQFFKDPSSLVFLEKAGSLNAPSEPLMVRSSLYQKFDPLHAKFFSQPNMKSNELQEIAENEDELRNLGGTLASDRGSEAETCAHQTITNVALVEVASDELYSNTCQETHESDTVPDIVNKHLSNVSPRQSLGNILISFDSPVINKDTVSYAENEKVYDPEKTYSEEELQQALKIKELAVQETFLKKQQEFEENFSKRQQELESQVHQQKCLSNSLHAVLKEAVDVLCKVSDKEKILKEKLAISETENVKLKEELKSSEADIQSVETTFSDFHKRYEQCKNMLKSYTENEKSLKQQLENMSVQLQEKEEMYKALQSRTEEMLDKANIEVANAKKAGDAQVAVLKAQLKKAELKISSLESDVKHVKIENGKLSSICDELMAKVSET